MPQSLLSQITKNYTNIAKHKPGLAAIIPNATMYHYRIYGLKVAANIQQQQYISDLIRMIHHPLFHTSPLKICLQQLQTDAATNLSILVSDLVFTSMESKTTTAKVVKTLHAQGLSLHNNNTPWPIPLPKAGTTINPILKDLPTFTNLKRNLSKHGFYFIEQFTNHSHTCLLTWKQTHHSIKKIPRGVYLDGSQE